MATKFVHFTAIKTVRKPTRVTFKTKSGKTVSFKAVRTLKRRRPVKFRAGKR